MRRLSIITGFLAVNLVGLAVPALADGWGNTNCGQVPSPVCELEAGSSGGGLPGGSSGHGTSPHRPGGGAGGGGQGSGGDTSGGSGNSVANCSYVRSDFQPPAGGVISAAYHPPAAPGGVVQAAMPHPAVARAAQPGQGGGAWYVWTCDTEGVAHGMYRSPVWMADGQAPGEALLPSPAELSRVARRQLRLPSPVIAASPAAEQLVNLPTWMWLIGSWRPVSATASVPGVSVTAVATPTSVTWVMGDGSTVTCGGPGTPYPVGGDPRAASPTCGHVYRRSSTALPGQVYAVSATVHWRVSWSGAGQGGVFPDLTTTGAAAFRVAESQVLNNGGG